MVNDQNKKRIHSYSITNYLFSLCRLILIKNGLEFNQFHDYMSRNHLKGRENVDIDSSHKTHNIEKPKLQTTTNLLDLKPGESKKSNHTNATMAYAEVASSPKKRPWV